MVKIIFYVYIVDVEYSWLLRVFTSYFVPLSENPSPATDYKYASYRAFNNVMVTSFIELGVCALQEN